MEEVEKLIWEKKKARKEVLKKKKGKRHEWVREGRSDEAVVRWRDRKKWSGKNIKEK